MHQIERRGLLRLKVQRCTLIFYPRHAYAPLPNPAHRPRLPLAGRVFGDGRGDDFGVAGWGRTATAVIPLPRHKCLAEKLLQTRLVSYPLKLPENLHRRVPAREGYFTSAVRNSPAVFYWVTFSKILHCAYTEQS